MDNVHPFLPDNFSPPIIEDCPGPDDALASKSSSFQSPSGDTKHTNSLHTTLLLRKGTEPPARSALAVCHLGRPLCRDLHACIKC